METTHVSKIDITFGKLDEIINWCETNCCGVWTFTVVEEAGQTPGKYRFLFDSETDQMNFILWKA